MSGKVGFGVQLSSPCMTSIWDCALALLVVLQHDNSDTTESHSMNDHNIDMTILTTNSKLKN